MICSLEDTLAKGQRMYLQKIRLFLKKYEKNLK